MNKLYMGGNKAVRLDDLPPEAWEVVVGEFDPEDAVKMYAVVAWMYRCVDIIGTAASTMPYDIMRGETVLVDEKQELPAALAFAKRFKQLLKLTAEALQFGEAYWFRKRNILMSTGLQWLNPRSIKPVIKEDGLQGFERRLKNKGEPQKLDIEDLVYFWLPDMTVEIGPAKNTPANAALSAAGVVGSMQEFLSGYFERGMIKATLLTYGENMPSKDEAQRVKTWWRRVVQGVKNAFSAEVVRGDFKPVTIGEGLKDLENDTLTGQMREDIATALGVPQSKVAANAANFATKNSDDLMFITDTIAPLCELMAEIINEQLFMPLGYKIVFRPERLPIMQEDEEQRAQSLSQLVDAGLPLMVALEVLGYNLTDEQIAMIEDEKMAKEERAAQIQQNIQNSQDEEDDSERIEEMRRFKRWLSNDSTRNPWDFDSYLLTPSDRVNIAAAMGIESDYKTADDTLYEEFELALNRFNEALGNG